MNRLSSMLLKTNLFLLGLLIPSWAFADLYECNGMWTNKPCEGGSGKAIKEETRERAPIQRQAAPVVTKSSASAASEAADEREAEGEGKAASAAALPKPGLLAMYGSYPLRGGNAVDSDGGLGATVVGRISVKNDECICSVTNTTKESSFKLDLALETQAKGETSRKRSTFSAVVGPGETEDIKRGCRNVASAALMLRSASR